MKNDQFAVYRVDRHSEGRDLWHLSYQEAVSRKLAIRIEYYRQMDIRPLLAGESAIALWKRMKESCEVSDVLVLNQNGEIHCYYVNEDYPQLLSGFIRLNPSGTLVTLDTENYRISGKPGNWMATDDIIIDGKQFYLMEHQEYHRQVAYIILDSYGKMIMEEYYICDGCDKWFEDAEGKSEITDKTNVIKPASGHKLSKVPAKDATCTEEGNKAYYICDRCDKWFEDAEGKSEIADKTSVIIPAAGHTLSDWKADDNSHWHECECGYKTDVAQHSFKWVVDKEANATQKGAKHKECTVCGYKRASVEIPATGTTTTPTTTPATTSKKDTTPTSTTTSAVKDPKTGDNSNIFLWIVLLLISGGTVSCIIVYDKKRKYNMK